MSDNGEEIINRLPFTSGLHNNQDARKLIENSIGAWFDNYNIYDWFNQFFLEYATGTWLDLHGKDKSLPRKINESDDDYRQRLIFENIGHLTVNYLMKVYDVELYTDVDNFDRTLSLISDNQYICDDGYLGVVDNKTQNILDNKFVLEGDVTWL